MHRVGVLQLYSDHCKGFCAQSGNWFEVCNIPELSWRIPIACPFGSAIAFSRSAE
jgi:hypothetical protein